MRYLDAAATRQALPMADAVEAMVHAFSGDAEAPLRSLVGSSFIMPGRLDDLVAVKIVSIVPGNPAGLVVVFGGDGEPLGLVDGPTVTAIRTGAVSGLATRLLAKENARTLAMLGDLPGTARIIFQPAEEELPSGAAKLVEEGVVDDLEALIAFHVPVMLMSTIRALDSAGVSPAGVG